MNEAIRVVCEMNGFEPVSEPTEKQRKFFADTAYADDELQLRRTILARIATLDTSVKDPTDEQLEETMEMLEMVMEVGAPQNEWEQSAVQRLHDVVAKSLESTRANGTAQQPEPPEDEASAQADVGGGITDEEWKDGDVRYVEKDGSYYRQTYRRGETGASSGWRGEVVQKDEWEAAQKELQNGGVPVLGDDPMKQATDSALAGLANMEPDKPAEPQARPGDLIDFAKTYKPQKLVKPEPGAEGTSSPNWANGAVVGKDDPEAFGKSAEPGAEGTSSPNWANGAVVGKNDPEAFGRVEHSWANGQDVAGFKDDAAKFGEEQPPAEAAVAGNEALPNPVEAGKGLFTVKPGGRYFDMQGRVITKRAADRMLRRMKKEEEA